MYINDNTKAIYIHIVKNGGNYVRSILQTHYNFRIWTPETAHTAHDTFYRTDRDREVDQDRYQHSITAKGKYRYYEANPERPNMKNKLATYFTFTFVRNPYERFLSAFAYLKRTLYNHKKTTGAFVLHKTPEDAQHYEDFATFVRDRDQITPVAYYHAFCPQYDQLVNENGEIKISYIGHVESLDDGLIECMTYLGKELRHTEELFYGKRANTNDWDDQDVTHYYTEEIFIWVNEHFHRDFEVFGYKKYESWDAFVTHFQTDKLERKQGKTIHLSQASRLSDFFMTLPTVIPATTPRTRPRITIPANIIQTFKTNKLHPSVYQNIQSFLAINPDHTYYLITDAIGEQLIRDHFDDRVLSAYKTLHNGSARGDFLRYVALYVYGGMYLDMDSGLFTSLTSFMPEETDFIFFYYNDNVMITQWIIMIQERHELMRMMIDEMVARIENKTQATSIIQITGPKLFSDVTYHYLNGEYIFHVQDVLSYEERLAKIVHHPHLVTRRGQILADLPLRDKFRFQFPGYDTTMLYYDERKYNEGIKNIFTPAPKEERVVFRPLTTDIQESSDVQVYKDVVLMTYGMRQQLELVQIYKQMARVLMSEVIKYTSYKGVDVKEIEIKTSEADAKMDDLTHLIEHHVASVVPSLYRIQRQQMISYECPECQWTTWSQLACDAHQRTCGSRSKHI